MAEPVKTTAETLRQRWPHGAALAEAVRRESGSDVTLLSFSRGKDSVAAALALRDRIDVLPFYCERIPGLSWVEESLSYYERHLFGGRKIIRMLHPATHDQLIGGIYHPPHYLPVTRAAELQPFDFADVQDVLVYVNDLPLGTMTATGLRAADSILRRTNLTRQGPVNRKKRTWMPIWDWTKSDVLEAIARAGLQLSADYRLFNRTFDGLMPEFLVPIKRHRPADWRRILELFPLAEAAVRQYEMAWGVA